MRELPEIRLNSKSKKTKEGMHKCGKPETGSHQYHLEDA
jgi:hypothetical protein